ncbi:MAG: Com family DNA-binding transcriptional regulator [Magnetococcales bacterium]|nr:Com family DNA-binding transcriptional regulator [Magnetococcales bacterium]
MLEELRCGQCNRLLAKGVGAPLEIKCPRCKTFNHFKGREPHQTKRPRALLQGDPDGANQKPVGWLGGR